MCTLHPPPLSPTAPENSTKPRSTYDTATYPHTHTQILSSPKRKYSRFLLTTPPLPKIHDKTQEYLELIERQEYQKAFAFLNRRLKPMEGTAASTPNEFLNLCYLLTCKTVADASHFRQWEGVLGGREKLADELAR